MNEPTSIKTNPHFLTNESKMFFRPYTKSVSLLSLYVSSLQGRRQQLASPSYNTRCYVILSDRDWCPCSNKISLITLSWSSTENDSSVRHKKVLGFQ